MLLPGTLPTQRVSRGDGPVRQLPERAADILSVPLTRYDGTPATVADVLADTHTDAYAVAHDGAVVACEGSAEPQALLSITKSIVGCVAGILVDRGQLDLGVPVTKYVPELADSGYAAATVEHVLDMRSGVRFREDYADPESEIRRLDSWLAERHGLYEFLKGLQAEAPHGSRFLYRSAESDVLGWVCERAAGAPMAELVSSLVWAPLGAERDAEFLTDAHGTAVHDGGLVMTARDLLRFGNLLLAGGAVPDGTQVIPPLWLRRAWAVDADARNAFLTSPAEAAFPGGWYRSQFWFRPGPSGDVLLCLGIHGQMLHVCRRTRTVCVKFSSWPDAQHPAYLQDTLRAFDAIGATYAPRRGSTIFTR
ncbi:serine hydrolase domain-containing protein [Kribbella sp. NPDC049174]|uniref:serine hydrolase domain-containing protein n=1 Tax=Kribbella sp. NPDC049174 TaxID=3364112 RepID=UPI0037115B14